MQTQTVNINFSSSNPNPGTEEQVKVILYLLQQVVSHFKTDVDNSKELYNLGAKTQLATSIEESIKDPLKNMLSASKNFDNIIIDFIDKTIIKSFLKRRSDIVDSIHKLNQQEQHLHYMIVLKEDNESNRDSIFDFFDKYDYTEVSKKYPVYFQFVSKDFATEMSSNISKVSL
jgi:hypothetical protein